MKNENSKAIGYLERKVTNGEGVISSTRALLRYLDDWDDEELEALISIDSQTDYVDLGKAYEFRFPSPRIGLANATEISAFADLQPQAIASATRSVISPEDKDFHTEMASIFSDFGELFENERLRILSIIRQ